VQEGKKLEKQEPTFPLFYYLKKSNAKHFGVVYNSYSQAGLKCTSAVLINKDWKI
jgi:hypothetical protein